MYSTMQQVTMSQHGLLFFYSAEFKSVSLHCKQIQKLKLVGTPGLVKMLYITA